MTVKASDRQQDGLEMYGESLIPQDRHRSVDWSTYYFRNVSLRIVADRTLCRANVANRLMSASVASVEPVKTELRAVELAARRSRRIEQWI